MGGAVRWVSGFIICSGLMGGLFWMGPEIVFRVSGRGNQEGLYEFFVFFWYVWSLPSAGY